MTGCAGCCRRSGPPRSSPRSAPAASPRRSGAASSRSPQRSPPRRESSAGFPPQRIPHNIIFLGNVNNVQHYLKACDAYVTTSKSEGLPNGVLEAMATGLPVVMSDIDQHQEIYNVDKRIGFVYKQDDPQSLIHALESIRNNTSQMSEAAYESAHNNFSAQKMGKQYQSIYLQL